MFFKCFTLAEHLCPRGNSGEISSLSSYQWEKNSHRFVWSRLSADQKFDREKSENK